MCVLLSSLSFLRTYTLPRLLLPPLCCLLPFEWMYHFSVASSSSSSPSFLLLSSSFVLLLPLLLLYTYCYCSIKINHISIMYLKKTRRAMQCTHTNTHRAGRLTPDLLMCLWSQACRKCSCFLSLVLVAISLLSLSIPLLSTHPLLLFFSLSPLPCFLGAKSNNHKKKRESTYIIIIFICALVTALALAFL